MHKPWLFWVFGFYADKAFYINIEKTKHLVFVGFFRQIKGQPRYWLPLIQIIKVFPSVTITRTPPRM